MRVAMVSEHASPLAVLGGADAGGQNVHVAALSTALADRGHQVSVATRRDAPGQPDQQPLTPGVQVVHLAAGPARSIPKDQLLPYVPAMADQLAAYWRRERPDVVHAHFWMSALAARSALATLDDPPPLVVTFHALGVVKRRHQGHQDTSPSSRRRLEAGLLRAGRGQVGAVVATCRDEVRELLRLGADPRRLHVVPCGVDVDRFAPVGPRRDAWTSGRLRLLSLGRLVERKGVATVVESLALLPDAELLVAGGPDPQDLTADPGTDPSSVPAPVPVPVPHPTLETDPDVRRLRAVARRAGVADQVRFVGRVTPNGAAALLRSADLVVSVPWYEPFGIVPLEAMACGTPVVASAVGGMLDTVQPGTGAHVPPRDPAAIATAVRRLTADPQALHRKGIAAADAVRCRYTWPIVAAETEHVYRGIVRPEVVASAYSALTVRREEEWCGEDSGEHRRAV
ncbi:MAG: glycosyltransferase [Angustibacter sp.]